MSSGGCDCAWRGCAWALPSFTLCVRGGCWAWSAANALVHSAAAMATTIRLGLISVSGLTYPVRAPGSDAVPAIFATCRAMETSVVQRRDRQYLTGLRHAKRGVIFILHPSSLKSRRNSSASIQVVLV